jgi:hypothetical protein
MTAQLNDLLARQRTADFTRSAERARLARRSRSTVPASSRAGWIARFLAAHRPEVGRSAALVTRERQRHGRPYQGPGVRRAGTHDDRPRPCDQAFHAGVSAEGPQQEALR